MKRDRGFRCLSTVVLIVFSLLALMPFILLVSSSFSSEQSLTMKGDQFWPSEFSLEGYRYISAHSETIVHAYIVTIVISVLGTLLSLLLTTMLAYPLSRKDFAHRGIFSFLVFFTTLFNGGLVPTYIMWTQLFSIKNTYLALLLPNLLMNAFHVILVKNYFSTSVPDSIIEAARIDGASEIRTFVRIVLPLSKPIIATVGLMTMLAYWNDWANGLYYVTKSEYFSIQVLLNNIMRNIQFLLNSSNMPGANVKVTGIPTASVRMAIAVLGIVPVLAIFPFFQKYFVKGITLGGVKG